MRAALPAAAGWWVAANAAGRSATRTRPNSRKRTLPSASQASPSGGIGFPLDASTRRPRAPPWISYHGRNMATSSAQALRDPSDLMVGRRYRCGARLAAASRPETHAARRRRLSRAVGDGADPRGPRMAPGQDRDGRGGVLLGHHGHEAAAHVEDLPHLGVGHRGGGLDEAEDRRRRQRALDRVAHAAGPEPQE